MSNQPAHEQKNARPKLGVEKKTGFHYKEITVGGALKRDLDYDPLQDALDEGYVLADEFSRNKETNKKVIVKISLAEHLAREREVHQKANDALGANRKKGGSVEGAEVFKDSLNIGEPMSAEAFMNADSDD